MFESLLSRKDERPAIEVVRELQNSDFRWMVLCFQALEDLPPVYLNATLSFATRRLRGMSQEENKVDIK